MGPPIYIGGNPNCTHGRTQTPRSFNGATDLYRWKQKSDHARRGILVASMGPPIYIGGNIQAALRQACWFNASMGPPIYIGGNWSSTGAFSRGVVLQWGHRFISVETNAQDLIQALVPGASMGPPIYIGGNSTPCGTRGTYRPRFNGATDLYRWKLSPAT